MHNEDGEKKNCYGANILILIFLTRFIAQHMLWTLHINDLLFKVLSDKPAIFPNDDFCFCNLGFLDFLFPLRSVGWEEESSCPLSSSLI